MKILAIDDNLDNLTVLKAVLLDRLPEATLLTATDAREGLELAGAEDPEVIILDIVMPVMDRYEVCRKLKADELLKTIPVLFLTAHTDRDSRLKALESGADGFLSKPFDELELVVQLRAMSKIKAATIMQRDDNMRLVRLVAERTRELQKSQTATLNLLEDLKAENAARKASEFRMRAITDSAQDAILMMDSEGVVSYWNPAAERIFGYTSTEAIGMNLRALIAPPRDHAAPQSFFPVFQKIGRGAVVEKMIEMEALRKDGREIAVELSISSLQIKDTWHSVSIIRDVTVHRMEEAELQKLRAAVEQSANIIVITDPSGKIEYVNPAFEKGSGYTAAEAMGNNPRVLKSGEQDAAFYKNLWETITAGKTWRGQFHNKRKDGSLYWEAATISPVHKATGEISHYVAVKEDITERKAMEGRLGEALIRAEAAAHAKSEFLAVMSHELRTPLNGVLGFAELLSYSPLDDEQRDYAQTIRDSGNHLLAVVNDVLDFSSIEKGTLTLHAGPVVISELLESSDHAISKAAADKGLEFRREVASGVPEQIIGDDRRIRQILLNLLGNAVKFTASGSVVFRVATASVGGRPALDFTVEDTGPGISPGMLGHLFKPFTQADSTFSREFDGTGLGLAISKRLAEAMDGSITVVSTPGQGSAFTFHFPLILPVSSQSENDARAGVSPHTNGSHMPPEGNLVLVVEDDRVNSKLIGKMLQSLGYRPEFAADGAEAVEVFAPGKFSAILMDMRMAVMDGLAATQKIRGMESQSRVPIIALTANVMPGDRERCLAAGMDDFLTKPFKRDQLAAKLARPAPVA